jgi:hypothetical protein
MQAAPVISIAAACSLGAHNVKSDEIDTSVMPN